MLFFVQEQYSKGRVSDLEQQLQISRREVSELEQLLQSSQREVLQLKQHLQQMVKIISDDDSGCLGPGLSLSFCHTLIYTFDLESHC